MPGLSSIVLHEMVLPLPPLEEQKRIVAKIEEIELIFKLAESGYVEMEKRDEKSEINNIS